MKQYVKKKAPKNFTAALAWINAVTVTPCARENGLALVEIKKITLIEKDTKDDSEKVLKEFVYDNDERKDFEGALFSVSHTGLVLERGKLLHQFFLTPKMVL